MPLLIESPTTKTFGPAVFGFGSLMTGSLSSQPPSLLDQVDCTANVPVDNVRACSGPLFSPQAHLSAFSSEPLVAPVQPPGPKASVSVSAYSWPATMDTPSSGALLRPVLTGVVGWQPGCLVPARSG